MSGSALAETLRIGERLRRLQINPGALAWEPSGERVVIEEAPPGGTRGIGIYTTANWARQSTLPLLKPSWSPDGSLLAAVDADGALEIHNADMSLSRRHSVVTNSIGWDGNTPVVYTGEIVRIEANNTRAIDSCTDGCLPARWWPGGGRVALTRMRGNDRVGVVLDLRSGEVRAELLLVEGVPAWAAKAPVLAWATSAGIGIWREGADTLTIDLPAVPRAISPLGTLVLCRAASGQWSLIHLPGRSVTAIDVPADLEQALDLSWSPDGRFLTDRVTTYGGVNWLDIWEAL